jgi:glucose/arabinose dehydrogenase
MKWLAGVLLVVACAVFPATAADRVVYQAGSDACDGWPRAPIGMAPGLCAGIVVAPPSDFATRILKFPRLLLPLPGGTDWLVTDLVGWGTRTGKVFRLTAIAGQPVQMKPLLTGLHMPHGLARGPDGKIYVGEMSRIFRFDPDAADPQASIEPVVTNLPDNRLHDDRHPLTFFIFDGNGDMLVDVGAPSDQCGAPGKPNGDTFCAESEGDDKRAVVRRYVYLGDGKWSNEFTVFARGLRNSLALVRHRSGTLLQAENGIDFPDTDSPFEKLNVLRSGAHYGWPYCYDMDQAAPVWSGTGAMDCASSDYTKPVRLLPPHAAPLSMLYYDGAMFPRLRGRLLMTWHGYQPAGARIAAFTVDRRGIPLLVPHARYAAYSMGDDIVTKPYPGPASEPLLLTQNWNEISGQRPKGTPVGLAVAEDGAIWVSEDKNATILRIARDRP